jgi:hypothetical protein
MSDDHLGAHDLLMTQINDYIGNHSPPDLPADAMLSVEEFRQLGHTPRILFPTASETQVAAAEAALGFPLPLLLKHLYSHVSNGIAGFSYDILGLEGGCSSDLGTLVDTYHELNSEGAADGTTSTRGKLPFYHWGCHIYSCVDCSDSSHHVFTNEDSELRAEGYTIHEFFEMWLAGRISRSEVSTETTTREITNPFTGKKTIVSGKKKRNH